MRSTFLAACFAVMIAPTISACSSHVACECPSIAPTVTMTITDAVSGATVQDPVFTVNGAPTNGQCIGVIPDDAGPDAGPDCHQWVVVIPVGHSTVTVGATGYQTQTFQFDATMSTGCCQTGSQLNQSVSLTH